MKNVDVIVDLQFGSTGKGAIAGYLAKSDDGKYDTVISANRPNAGHTYIDSRGNKMIHKVLPNSCVGATVRTVLIGPGSVFSSAQLYNEMNRLKEMGYSHFRVCIHEAAVVLDEAHRNAEEGYNERIGSTQQGAATAIMHKMERDINSSPLAKDAELSLKYCRVLTASEYMTTVMAANSILLEGAQGYSLGIDAGFWPYCTSRNCTVTQFLADAGVPHGMVRKVIGTARTYPIRVAGNSGPCYLDQEELTWEFIDQKPELTTVTQRVRRVFSFSDQQMEEAITMNRPDEIFLSFCDYVPRCEAHSIQSKIEKMMYDRKIDGKVRYLGFGPNHSDIVDLEKDLEQ